MTTVGEWVFRHAGGCLIDWPDLPIPPSRIAWRWVATLWPDALRNDGYAALEWDDSLRGWQIPMTLSVGDVIEFGITTHDPAGEPIEASTHRWYGWLDHATEFGLIVWGPYPHPSEALADSRARVDELRIDQLDPPVEALIELIRAAADRPEEPR